MGLDITAYSRLESVGAHTVGWCEQDDHISAYAYPNFPQSFRGIPVLGERTTVGGEQLLNGGCFVATEKTERHDFQAGSYTSYGAWREDLQEQFNPRRHRNSPFYELIWFADNEGCIGPDAAADLLADFRAHADRYQPPTEVLYGRGKYEDWTRAFELAADGGLVRFH